MAMLVTGANVRQKTGFGWMLLDKLASLAANPPDQSNRPPDKQSLPWFAPHDDTSGKTKEHREAHGYQTALSIDIDDTQHTIEHLRTVLGNLKVHRYVIYSTASATPSNPRWRIVIPLSVRTPIDQWLKLQYALTKLLGGDESVCRTTQVSFLPVVTKLNKDCYQHHIECGESLDPYKSTLAVIAWNQAPPTPPSTPRTDDTTLELSDLEAALRYIDPGCSRTEWIRIGLALKHYFKDDDAQGREVFGGWSAGDFWGEVPHNYESDHIDAQWDSFKVEGGITAATLFYKALQGGWTPPASFDTSIAFGPAAAPVEVFNDLLIRIRSDGSSSLEVPAIVEAIQAAKCNPLQVALLAAELKSELAGVGVKDKVVSAQIDKLLQVKSSAAPVVVQGSSGFSARTGSPIMSPTAQLECFKGCVYVLSLHRILTPEGDLLKPEQFNARYGGYAFVFTQDGKTTRKPFEVFIESQVIEFQRVHGTCFRPDLPLGHIVSDSGRRLVNTFIPAFGLQIQGDVSPFLQHVERLLPDPVDREIFLSYLAACVQRIGTKFQWCVVLQGVEGNGKTVFYRVLAYALGERYTHLPNATDITNRFNSWLENKLLIGIEELHTSGRHEVADALKPLITNPRIEVQAKGQDQRVVDNRANFLIFSNHKDAVLKTERDRRYSVFYSAQQEHSDFARDGMDGNYFKRLYSWLETGGYANVAYYLATRPITVDVLGRAPVTTSTAEAIRSSAGVAEQLIQEAIELEEFGFRGDLICTKVASDLLRNAGKKLGPQRVAVVLENIGYIKHPALVASSGKIRIDNFRRRLYVKRGSLAAMLPNAIAVAEHWKRAQQVPSCPSGPTVSNLLDRPDCP